MTASMPPAVAEYLAAEDRAQGITAQLHRLRTSHDLVTLAGDAGIRFATVEVTPDGIVVTIADCARWALDTVAAVLHAEVTADREVPDPTWGRTRHLDVTFRRVPTTIIGAPARAGGAAVSTETEGLNSPIFPPFTCYQLVVEAGRRNSPPLPAVHLLEQTFTGGYIRCHTLTPEQARELAAHLIAAADKAGVTP